MDGPVHGGEEAVPGGLGRGLDGGGGDRVQPGQVGDRELGCREDGRDGVPFDPALDPRMPAVALGPARAAREDSHGGDDLLAVEVVAAHHVQVVAGQVTPADGTAVDGVHHQSVVDEGA